MMICDIILHLEGDALNQLKNQSGYLTIESAFIVPSLLLLVCLFVGFFCICFKLGAFQALVNHECLVAETQGTKSYEIGQIADSQTVLVKNEQAVKPMDDLTKIEQNFQVEMAAPFYKGHVVEDAQLSRWQFPMLYQLWMAKQVGGGMDQLRDHLGGRP